MLFVLLSLAATQRSSCEVMEGMGDNSADLPRLTSLTSFIRGCKRNDTFHFVRYVFFEGVFRTGVVTRRLAFHAKRVTQHVRVW